MAETHALGLAVMLNSKALGLEYLPDPRCLGSAPLAKPK
jgi:hypothetical protein